MPDTNDLDEQNKTSDLPNEVARRARDMAYVAVGLGVLGLQRAQAARHELAHQARQDRLEEGADRLRAGIATGAQQFGEWLDGARTLVSSQLAPPGSQLPEPARELATKARTLLEEVGAKLRQLVAPGG